MSLRLGPNLMLAERSSAEQTTSYGIAAPA
jgi:hypothetical protein